METIFKLAESINTIETKVSKLSDEQVKAHCKTLKIKASVKGREAIKNLRIKLAGELKNVHCRIH